MSVWDFLSDTHSDNDDLAEVSFGSSEPLIEKCFKALLHSVGIPCELSDLLKGIRKIIQQEEVLHVLNPDSSFSLKLDCMACTGELHSLEHQADHLLPASEQRVAKGEVDCVDEAVIEEPLFWQQAEMQE